MLRGTDQWLAGCSQIACTADVAASGAKSMQPANQPGEADACLSSSVSTSPSSSTILTVSSSAKANMSCACRIRRQQNGGAVSMRPQLAAASKRLCALRCRRCCSPCRSCRRRGGRGGTSANFRQGYCWQTCQCRRQGTGRGGKGTATRLHASSSLDLRSQACWCWPRQPCCWCANPQAPVPTALPVPWVLRKRLLLMAANVQRRLPGLG